MRAVRPHIPATGATDGQPAQADPVANDQDVPIGKSGKPRVRRLLLPPPSSVKPTIPPDRLGPATQRQMWFLKYRGGWREGMTKHEAYTIIRDIKELGL